MHSRLRTLALEWMMENRPGVVDGLRREVRGEFEQQIKSAGGQ